MQNEEQTRLERLQKIKDLGINPYPARAKRTHTVKKFLADFDSFSDKPVPTFISGRIRTIRRHGGLTFVHIEDATGKLQLVLKKDTLGEDLYTQFHDIMDMGDFIEVSGGPFVTKKGENSLEVMKYRILSKSLLPQPEKWHGLTDQEMRYRQRYLDLLSNEQVRNIFKIRATIVTTIRRFLDERGYLEVETPILQAIPGGASAKPFKTHHNALHADMYLRIAPELYLKRLLVGGYERVYEVSRCFRNEGIDQNHNPEFTQIEAYTAYMDYHELMELIEKMLLEVIEAIGLDASKIPFRGDDLDFSAPWQRMTFRDILIKYANIDIEDYPTKEDIINIAKEKDVHVDESDSHGTVIDNIYKQLVRPNIIQPVYIYDYPAEISPLVKRSDKNEKYIEMFQLVYGGGVENIKAFSELNDPIDQEARFKEQDLARASGDEEAQFSDMDYVTAMKHGMPPNAGFGIGIDRLTAMLTDSTNLKEVILFPTLRPEKEE